MEIRLKNIGIVSDSKMQLNGLTVITGKNNSGKTTVGKTLYSLLDAVSNISAKARNDRAQYILGKLEDVVDAMDLFRFLGYKADNMKESILMDYPAIRALFSRHYVHDIPQNEIEDFVRKFHSEILGVNVDAISKDESLSIYIRHYSSSISKKDKENINIKDMIVKQISEANSILTDLFDTLEKDPQLVEYARESITQTLSVEFSGQIQPVNFNAQDSKIDLYSEDTCFFKMDIINNRVINDGNPVFFTSPYKKVYFIDNPFVLDENKFIRGYSRRRLDSDSSSLLNPVNIVSHSNKLRYTLYEKQHPTVLEQTLLNESLKKVKNEIDSILPGTFEFSQNGNFYVQDGKKLKISNLATGSKMFSIIKMLLEKGELGKTTMLILDEPEAHLHPSWQNRFAEMIVLLVKELKVNVLLTTHSSNFVLALDAYMRKHSIEQITNFYKTNFIDQGKVDYVCVNDDIGTIYQDFLQYLSEVKMLRNECVRNVGDEA